MQNRAPAEPSSAPFEIGDVPRRGRPRRRTAPFFILIVTVVLVGNAVVGERGLLALLRVQRESVAVSRVIETLRADNDALRERIRQLREEPRIIEEVAREELGLIEPGEILFIVSDTTERALPPVRSLRSESTERPSPR